MHRFPLLLVALAVAFPATASAKTCSTDAPNAGNLTAKNVSCKKANIIANSIQGGETRPFGFKCTSKPYEGGSTTTCKKGDKRVRFQVAD